MSKPLHPLHAIFLAGALPLFLGVLLCDIAYASNYQVQWKNFASWLLVGALTVGSVAVAWALVDLVRGFTPRGLPRFVYVAAVATAWALGFVNSLVHASDAWASMPEGLFVSLFVAILWVVAVWAGFTRYPLTTPVTATA